MGEEKQAKKTPVTATELFTAMCIAWRRYFEEEPSKSSIVLLMSHWAFETGYGKAMWNYNLGNVKAKVGGSYDYCFFACNEILPKAKAEVLQSQSPTTAKITKYRSNGKCVIWFYPKHPACCFRSFDRLDNGAADHLNLMHKRFNKAWPFVVSADPAAFCHALRLQGYYTADEALYTNGVVKIFENYTSMLDKKEIEPTPVPWRGIPSADDFTPSRLEALDPSEQCGVHSNVSMAEIDKEES